jgi:hypothetical protein
MPDSHVIRCPHCSHRVELPAEWLGQVVSCLECTKAFRAPVLDSNTLTAPQVIARTGRVPVIMVIPLFGLLTLGVAGLAINGYLLHDPKAAVSVKRGIAEQLFAEEPPEVKEWKAADKKRPPDDAEMRRRAAVVDAFQRDRRQGIDRAVDDWPEAKGFRYGGLAASAVMLVGGFAILIRRGYVLAFIGSFASLANAPDLGCCFLGLILAPWGLMALIGNDGRRYFRRGE